MSVTQAGSLWKTEFGEVSEFVASVAHCVPSAQVPVGGQAFAPLTSVVVQPAGKLGAVTPSKFSENMAVAQEAVGGVIKHATCDADAGSVSEATQNRAAPSC